MTDHNMTRVQAELSNNPILPSSVLHNGTQVRAAYTRHAARHIAQSLSMLIRGASRKASFGKNAWQNPAVSEA